MNGRYLHTFFSTVLCLALLCLLAGCARTPDNTQIEMAIREELLQEASPPNIDFSNMSVPTRYSDKAMAVVKSIDGSIVRGYLIGYNHETHSFTAKLDYSRQLDLKVMEYYEPVEQTSPVTSYYFDFSQNPDAEYALFYVGEGDSIGQLRATYEKNQLGGFPGSISSQFEVCDLGGDTVLLLVPHYEGLKVWVNEINHQGDVMFSGEEVARFEKGMPVYLYCSFDDKLPAYEIHVSFDDKGHFFTTNNTFLEKIMQDNQQPNVLMTRQLK